MTRKQLEALVWRETHADYKGRSAAGTRELLVMGSAGGSVLVDMKDLTLGELCYQLKASVRRRHALLAWMVVVEQESTPETWVYRVRGVFTPEEHANAEQSRRFFERASTVPKENRSVLLWKWAGPVPVVGELIEFAGQSLTRAQA